MFVDQATRFGILRAIGDAHGPRKRGKILQRLLQIAFGHCGFRVVEERLVEGLDFDAVHRENPNLKVCFEVRTTESREVPVKAEDLSQIDMRQGDGYRGGVAMLRIAPGQSWRFVDRDRLMVGKLRTSCSTFVEWKKLAVEVNRKFDELLVRHETAMVDQGLDGLGEELMKVMRLG